MILQITNPSFSVIPGLVPGMTEKAGVLILYKTTRIKFFAPNPVG